MTIRELINLGLYDENEYIVVLSGYIQKFLMEYKGILYDIPEDLKDYKIEEITSMSDFKKDKFRIYTVSGVTEIWIDKED